MAEEALKVSDLKGEFRKKVREILPKGNLDLCLTCGTCSGGCPATGLENMDPRKFVRMVVLGLDEEVTSSPWVWMCSMCQRCIYACPMAVDIPQMVGLARQTWPREERPKGILGSCDMALRHDTCSAMGTSEEDFEFVVVDVLEEVQEEQPGWEKLEAPINKKRRHVFPQPEFQGAGDRA
jgi:heterodisulfide reductase subunit C